MYEDPIPVEIYVSQCFLNPVITKTISNWRIEPAKIQTVIVQNVRDLGINFVLRQQKKPLLDFVLFCLKRSKEIRQMVKRAETEEKERKRSRHADV